LGKSSSENNFEKAKLLTSGIESFQKQPIDFKRRHSTTHALLRTIDRITHGFNNSKAKVSLFLDIERELYKVKITRTVVKLITATIPPLCI
jgi:hypothetical protein